MFPLLNSTLYMHVHVLVITFLAAPFPPLHCSISPRLESEMDVALAAQNLAGNFMGVVQYNRDNTAFEVCLIVLSAQLPLA